MGITNGFQVMLEKTVGCIDLTFDVLFRAQYAVRHCCTTAGKKNTVAMGANRLHSRTVSCF